MNLQAPERGERCRIALAHATRAGSRQKGWDQTMLHGICRRALIAIAVLASLSSCKAAQEPVVVPPDLIGVWKTDDPRYVDRHFELKADTIILSMGAAGTDSHPIQKFEKRQDPRGTSYFLTYKNLGEGVEDTLSFDYEMGAGGAIRFKNQRNIVWKKEPKP